jgi:hypothetical protein
MESNKEESNEAMVQTVQGPTKPYISDQLYRQETKDVIRVLGLFISTRKLPI